MILHVNMTVLPTESCEALDSQIMRLNNYVDQDAPKEQVKSILAEVNRLMRGLRNAAQPLAIALDVMPQAPLGEQP